MRTQAAHDRDALIQDSISENPSFMLVPQSLQALLQTTSPGYVSEYLFSCEMQRMMNDFFFLTSVAHFKVYFSSEFDVLILTCKPRYY